MCPSPPACRAQTHPCALEALHFVQEWLLKQLEICVPGDLALTARRAAALGWLAAPGKNSLRRVAGLLDFSGPSDVANTERAAARLGVIGKPMIQLRLVGLQPEEEQAEWYTAAGLAEAQRQRAAWEANIVEQCGRLLAAYKPLYIEVTVVHIGDQGGECLDLLQAEALQRFFGTLKARVLLHTPVSLYCFNPKELEDTGLATENFPLGAAADPHLPDRLLRLLGSPLLDFEEVRLRLCSAVLPALTACVERGGITVKLRIEHVLEGTQPSECAAFFAVMARLDAAPFWLEVFGLNDGGGTDEEGVLQGTEVVFFIPPAAACARFSCFDLPLGAEAALAGWPVLRRASFEFWNFLDHVHVHAWTRLPRTLTQITLNMNGGVFTTEQLPLAEQLLRDTEHLPALKTVKLEGFEHLQEKVEPSEFKPPEPVLARRHSGPPSRARKHIDLQCSPLVANFLVRHGNMARWRSHLSQFNIGLRLEDGSWGLKFVRSSRR